MPHVKGRPGLGKHSQPTSDPSALVNPLAVFVTETFSSAECCTLSQAANIQAAKLVQRTNNILQGGFSGLKRYEVPKSTFYVDSSGSWSRSIHRLTWSMENSVPQRIGEVVDDLKLSISMRKQITY